MPKVTEQIYEDAKSKFLTLQPEINEMAMKLKELKKQKTRCVSIIKRYMVMQDKYFLKVGPFEVSREKVQRCGFNENRMRKFLRKKQLEEDYKEEYTKIGTKFKLNRVDTV